MKNISQAEARRLKKEVQHLKWLMRYGGVRIDTLHVTNTEACIVDTARRLDHVVIARNEEGDKINLFAFPRPQEV
jgi:hypothetical protein